VTRVVVIAGHPDPAPHFGHALADAYEKAAREAGHEVKRIDVARLEVPFLRSQDEWRAIAPPPALREAQAAIAWAEHLVIVFPLWLGDMPALLKAFFEQVLRPGFAIGDKFRRLLKGRSARLVVTMGMPGFFYRLYYRGHSVKSLKRNVLEFCGISPVRTSLIGLVEAPRSRDKWLAKVSALGRKAR
jgi:putative NADPH-quinone reductase